ncbi:MAG: SEC-C domain-containing protein [Myxococcales bacterium]|nr:SEC-C domain-containing protein [Myxococcales bacterium]
MLDAREHELLQQWPKPEDIPEDIAMGMVFQTSISLLEQPEQLNSFLVLLTAIVSLEPEQMFWPEALCDIFYNKWEVDDGLALLKHWGGIHQGPQPVRNEPKIGRNAPCPCGSGKKYKRCCIDS